MLRLLILVKLILLRHFILKQKWQVKQVIIEQKKNKIMVPLKFLSNFWKAFEMSLINCELNLILTWSANFVIVSTNNANQGATYAINETKLYVPVVTLSTQYNVKLLQLKSGFKRTIKWKENYLKTRIIETNRN